MKTSSGSFSSKDSETDEDGRVTPSGGHNNNNGQMSMNSNSNYSCSAMLRELSKKRLKSTESSPNNTDQPPTHLSVCLLGQVIVKALVFLTALLLRDICQSQSALSWL